MKSIQVLTLSAYYKSRKSAVQHSYYCIWEVHSMSYAYLGDPEVSSVIAVSILTIISIATVDLILIIVSQY